MKLQKLLIVDDSPDIHELVGIWLAGESLEFFSCETGEESAEIAYHDASDAIPSGPTHTLIEVLSVPLSAI